MLLSGGLDSTVLMAHLPSVGVEHGVALSIEYGQRHSKEVDAAQAVAAYYRAPFVQLDLSALRPHLAGSALTDSSVPVPDGHYAEESMRATVVPNRNMIMVAVATAVAVSRGFDIVAMAVHAGDHFIYPDCRPAFVGAAAAAAYLGTDGFAPDGRGVELWAPFTSMTKADIVSRGARLGAPMGLSWSCYKGAEIACGVCGTCYERQEAFALADVADPTTYAVSQLTLPRAGGPA